MRWQQRASLDYYRARYYSPQLGRFISEDPIGIDGGSNLYACADGDPISGSDPLGLSGWPSLPQGVADAATGAADAASLGLGPIARAMSGVGNGGVNRCSTAYKAGEYGSLLFGSGRLLYAGAAKALPFLIRSGETELARALEISAARNTLKQIGRVGLFPNWRMPTAAEVLLKYKSDPAEIIRASTHTNAAVNATAVDATVGAVVGIATGCGCN